MRARWRVDARGKCRGEDPIPPCAFSIRWTQAVKQGDPFRHADSVRRPIAVRPGPFAAWWAADRAESRSVSENVCSARSRVGRRRSCRASTPTHQTPPAHAVSRLDSTSSSLESSPSVKSDRRREHPTCALRSLFRRVTMFVTTSAFNLSGPSRAQPVRGPSLAPPSTCTHTVLLLHLLLALVLAFTFPFFSVLFGRLCIV